MQRPVGEMFADMSMRITRIVTKTGDHGETSLVHGTRLPKDSLRVSAYGDVDELNSWIGVVRSHPVDARIAEMLEEIQHQLFVVGSDLATPPDRPGTRVEESEIQSLESFMEELMGVMDPLQEFVLPCGTPAASFLHVARTVARRAERSVVSLMRESTGSDLADQPDLADLPGRANLPDLPDRPPASNLPLVYLNRLSDLLFVMARVANHRAGATETRARFSKKPLRQGAHTPAADRPAPFAD